MFPPPLYTEISEKYKMYGKISYYIDQMFVHNMHSIVTFNFQLFQISWKRYYRYDRVVSMIIFVLFIKEKKTQIF